MTHSRHNLVLWTIRIIPGSPYFPCGFSMAGDKTLITLFAFPLHLIEHSQQQSERSGGEGCARLLFYCYSNAPQTAFWMAKLNSGSVRLETESILAEHTQEEGLLCVQLCAKHTHVLSPVEATLKMSLEVEGSWQNRGILLVFRARSLPIWPRNTKYFVIRDALCGTSIVRGACLPFCLSCQYCSTLCQGLSICLSLKRGY